jgi:hypothetical protein
MQTKVSWMKFSWQIRKSKALQYEQSGFYPPVYSLKMIKAR